VIVDRDAFRWRARPVAAAVVTPAARALHRAVVHGPFPRAVVSRGRVTVRLQGVDTPELHVRAASGLTLRQPFGETAVAKLVSLLAGRQARATEIPIVVRRRSVARASEVFDVYGRFVGEAFAGRRSINRWLLSSGWALPTFYSSMSLRAIRELSECARAASIARLGVWAGYTSDLWRFDPSLIFRKRGRSPDRGDVLFPMLFRRLCRMVAGGFEAALNQSSDQAWLLSDLVSHGQGAQRYRWRDLFAGARTLPVRPEALVFRDRRVVWW
jgi:endonuclease YncB( thermonuclease family)